jgi:hypothetical protein
MKFRTVLPFLVLATAFAMSAAADEKKEGDKNARFEQFKQLAGEWVGTASEPLETGKEVHVKYKVTAAGSAVVETLLPDTDHEMVTVIYPDGDDIALTHYCAMGNQPHMKADAKGAADKVGFKFVSCSNMKSDKEGHMHEVTYTFVDRDTLKAEWVHYHDGKAAGTVTFELKRKK